jgi:hypothetical protein
MKFINHKQQLIHPEDGREIRELAYSWGISMRQLNEAIVDTGSFNKKQLKMHLKQKGVLNFSFAHWIHSVMEKAGLARMTKRKATFS